MNRYSARDWAMEPLAAGLAVALKRVLDDRQRDRRRLELVDLDRLPFKLLVVLEEASEHHQTMRRQLGGLLKAVELGVADRDREDLVVALAAVDHRHQADRAGLDQRQWGHRFLAQHQHVERIVVFGQRLRNEAVVGRIVHG